MRLIHNIKQQLFLPRGLQDASSVDGNALSDVSQACGEAGSEVLSSASDLPQMLEDFADRNHTVPRGESSLCIETTVYKPYTYAAMSTNLLAPIWSYKWEMPPSPAAGSSNVLRLILKSGDLGRGRGGLEGTPKIYLYKYMD